MFVIVVLSPNYASSTWCLNELQKIVECRNNPGQWVITVFYGVDPSDVRHQRGSFAEAFRKHEERFEPENEKVQIWKNALKQVADISGWDSKDRVLLVVDDVSELNQLENLAGNLSWFGPGSRVIVTTRDKHLLAAHGVYEGYEVGGLNNDEALELFCRKAFKTDHPGEGYFDLSKEVIKYAAGLPLAFEVLGSFLCGRTVDAWHCALTQMKKVPYPKIPDTLKKVPYPKIPDTLKISYDALHPLEKNMFLNIACFFKGMYKHQVTETWEKCGLCPGIVIETLSEKSLIN